MAKREVKQDAPFVPASAVLPANESVGYIHPGIPEPIAEALANGIQVQRDRDILSAALSRLARLHGQPFGEHTADLDTAGLSPEYVPVVEWAKWARLP